MLISQVVGAGRYPGATKAREIASDLRASYRIDLGEIAAFLPNRVPLESLPGPYGRYLAACAELPTRYRPGGDGVRGWLTEVFAHHEPGVMRGIADLDRAERETLMTALSVLGHTYRWDQVPPADERFDERRITLPPGIAGPWSALARAMDQPRVGTTWSMHLCNWQMTDRPGGAAYRTEELTIDNLRVARNWLLPPVDSHLDRFSVAFVLMEAKGAPVLLHLVSAIEAAAHGLVDATAAALERVRVAIDAMTLAFSASVRKQTIDPATWLTLVQPTFAWSAEGEEPGRIEGGPSGMQVGTVQALDASLGIGGDSTLARAAQAGRRLMPAPHRQFLGHLDRGGPVLRQFVLEARCPELTKRYDGCIRSVLSFRSTHRSRGALYLRNRPSDGGRRVSTGLTITLDDDPLAVFDQTAADRAAETRDALLTTVPIPLETVQERPH